MNYRSEPFLDRLNIAPESDCAGDPYANRPDALCPSTSPVRHYNIVVMMLPVQLTSTRQR